MQIGIGLPAHVPGVKGNLLLEWATLADQGSFSSLGILDRLLYPNYEPLITLATAAGATRRIRLMTTVMIAPLRNTAILAKQAASLDALSGGRLTLGLGVGGREDDFHAVDAPFHHRGRRFEQQLSAMQRVWSGQPLNEQTGAIGPAPVRPGGPEVLIGGYSPMALRRVGKWGDGIILGGSMKPDMARQFYDVAQEAWQAGGKSGKPRFVCCVYYGLGPHAAEGVAQTIRNYYAFLQARAEALIAAIPTTTAAVQDAIDAFAAIGADELILWPCIADIEQLHRLAEVVS
jgi:alkanesulfonate monooxygenase SsuD/methylene tetrahydromethanopterin reductase-like flavin-dependent oxidoreductase (luciferase family)